MEVYFQKSICYNPKSVLSQCNKHSITDSVSNRMLSKAEAQLYAYDADGCRPPLGAAGG